MYIRRNIKTKNLSTLKDLWLLHAIVNFPPMAKLLLTLKEKLKVSFGLLSGTLSAFPL